MLRAVPAARTTGDDRNRIMPMITSFNFALASYLRAHAARTSPLFLQPEYRNTDTKLPLRRFDGHLSAYLTRTGVSVAAEWDFDVWDYVFSQDVSPEQGPAGGWRCGFCPEHDASEYLTIEQLWADHLFEPFLTCAENQVAEANAMYLCDYERGAKWAVLSPEDEVRSPHALYAVYPVLS